MADKKPINKKKDGGHNYGWHIALIQDKESGSVVVQQWYGETKPSEAMLWGDLKALFYLDGYWYNQKPD